MLRCRRCAYSIGALGTPTVQDESHATNQDRKRANNEPGGLARRMCRAHMQRCYCSRKSNAIADALENENDAYDKLQVAHLRLPISAAT